MWSEKYGRERPVGAQASYTFTSSFAKSLNGTGPTSGMTIVPLAARSANAGIVHPIIFLLLRSKRRMSPAAFSM